MSQTVTPYTGEHRITTIYCRIENCPRHILQEYDELDKELKHYFYGNRPADQTLWVKTLPPYKDFRRRKNLEIIFTIIGLANSVSVPTFCRWLVQRLWGRSKHFLDIKLDTLDKIPASSTRQGQGRCVRDTHADITSIDEYIIYYE